MATESAIVVDDALARLLESEVCPECRAAASEDHLWLVSSGHPPKVTCSKNLRGGSGAAPPRAPVAPQRVSRRVDLAPYLNGSYVAPQPSAGLVRDDGLRLLYPARWHTCVGPTASGKSWLALAHARDEMLNAERTVVYVHFEESSPAGTLDRLRSLGLTPELLAERFVWLDNSRIWERDHLATELAELTAPGLVVLDGINAACTRHQQDPAQPVAVGWYRDRFAAPAAATGAAVLSLGHPPKARDRQDERHGFGSTAWLDEVDGVGFRLTASRTHPIRRGASGSASLHSVKDRYGSVERLGVVDTREGWVFMGSLVVDDSGLNEGTAVRLSAPARGEGDAGPDAVDRLAEQIEKVLGDAPGRRYESERQLGILLRAAGAEHAKEDLPVALERMEHTGRLVREVYAPRRSRPGWLPDPGQDQDEEV